MPNAKEQMALKCLHMGREWDEWARQREHSNGGESGCEHPKYAHSTPNIREIQIVFRVRYGGVVVPPC